MLFPALAFADVPYDVKFTGLTGVPDETLINAQLSDASQLVALKDKTPSSKTALRRRAETDMARLKSVLESSGYYDAGVSFTLDTEATPAAVTVLVQPGPAYILAKVLVTGPKGAAAPDADKLTPEMLSLNLGKPAIAAPIAAADGKIVVYYKDHGWPLAKLSDRKTVIDTAKKTMDVTYVVTTGPAARFGAVHIDGLTKLESRYVERRIAWRKGELYDQRKVDKTRDTLVGSALFGTVAIEPVAPVTADGTIRIRIHSVERVSHTLSFGGNYNTSEGVSVDASWEDRDLFGGAESLKATLIGGQSHNEADLAFRRPDLFVVNQDLISKISFDNELVNAFRSIGETASLGVERLIEPGLTVSLSAEGDHARINEIVDTRTYTLVGLPMTLHLDRSDDLLNPTKGYRADIIATPYIGPFGSDLTYGQIKLSGTYYESLDDKNANILAFRAVAGGTFGTSFDSIPKDHRFYAGGGGSVRGFGYQKAGPRDQYYNVIGGRSLLQASAELRMRLTDTIGIVPFLDAAEVNANEAPDFTSKVYAGAGIGLRYYTAIGPLRLDLATPLDPRSRGDSPVQIYVSLGQAF